MTIVRREHRDNFTIVPNAMFLDERLSVEAKGVLGFLLSRPHKWQVRLEHIGRTLRIGRKKLQRIFRELISAGYVTREQQRFLDGHRFGELDYVVCDVPDTSNVAPVSPPVDNLLVPQDRKGPAVRRVQKGPTYKEAPRGQKGPDTGNDLCSQPTISRWENAPTLREIVKLSGVLIDLYCASYAAPPQAVTLDIDDTCDVAHGHQQLSLFNAHYDERCFLPIHVYDTAAGCPIAIILRPGKTPSGKEVRGHLRRLARRIRAHWPTTKITIRGDGHYGRREVMDWCEDNGLDYVFGLPGNKILAAAVEDKADDIRTRRALEQAPVLRGYTQTNYAAKSWKVERRVCARIEATELGLDIRYVVTNIANGSPEHIYDTLYCARGQMENLVKLHKSQLASDRTSCRAPLAIRCGSFCIPQYWLMRDLRNAIPKTHTLAVADFVTLREKLLKIGARIVETASRIKLVLATACPQANLFRHLAGALQPAGP